MMRLSCWVNNHIRINNTNATSSRRRLRASLSVTGGESTMANNSVRVAAAQMTSVTDLASNFSTCSRLVKVTTPLYILFIFHFTISYLFFCFQRKLHQLELNCFVFPKHSLLWVLKMVIVLVLLNLWMDLL